MTQLIGALSHIFVYDFMVSISYSGRNIYTFVFIDIVASTGLQYITDYS